MDLRFSMGICDDRDGEKYSHVVGIGDKDGENIEGQSEELRSIILTFSAMLTSIY